VVPVLTVLAYWEAWGPGSGCNGVSLRQQLDVTGKALLASPYFRAKGGRDHLVLAGHSGLKYVDRGLQPPTYFAMVRLCSCGPALTCAPAVLVSKQQVTRRVFAGAGQHDCRSV